MNKYLKSLIVFFGLTVVGLLINLISYFIFQKMPFSIRMSGGDIVEYIGFGIKYVVEYSSNVLEVQNIYLSFDWITFVVPLFVFFVMILIMLSSYEREKKNDSKSDSKW